MPVVMGTRGVLDRLFSPAGSPRTLFAPAGINGEAQASDVITLGRNEKADAIWSVDQWDQWRSYHSTAPDPYLEVHGFEPEHDRLVLRSGKGTYSFFAVETDADGDGREDLLLGRYDYDKHGGGSGPGRQGFYDLYALLDNVTASELGLTVFAGGRYGENLYWVTNQSSAYPPFIQVSSWDSVAAEYATVPGADLVPIPLPPDPDPDPTPDPDPDPPGGGGSGGHDPDHGHGGGGGGHGHGHGGGGQDSGGNGGAGGGAELVPLPPLDPYQRLTDAVARRTPITSRSKKPNQLRGSDDLDVIQPWRGRDTVTGLGDTDAVLLVKRAEFGRRRDVVTDFAPGADHLFLTRRFADYGKRFRFEATGEGLTLQQGQRLGKGFIYDSSTGGLWFNENGRRPGWGDGGLAVLFEGVPAITAADWTVS